MSETAYLRTPVSPVTIADRDFDKFQAEFCCTEKQIKISEGIEFSKISPACNEFLIVLSPENLGPAEGIPDSLLKQIGKGPAEEFVAKEV